MAKASLRLPCVNPSDVLNRLIYCVHRAKIIEIIELFKTSSDPSTWPPDVTVGGSPLCPLLGKEMGIGWTDLCIDRLQVWADKSCLHRFDRFNNKQLGLELTTGSAKGSQRHSLTAINGRLDAFPSSQPAAEVLANGAE